MLDWPRANISPVLHFSQGFLLAEGNCVISSKEIGDLTLAVGLQIGKGLPAVTVREAFRVTFDSLMRATGRTASDVAEEIGVSQATFTKLRKGQRGASFNMLERMRLAFGVTPAALFDPDAALAQIGLARRDSDTTERNRHTSVASDKGAAVGSGSPTTNQGGSALAHPDPELFAALEAFWDGLTSEARLELVGHGHRLRKASAAPTVGFKAG